MTELPFYQVDAFADRPFTGNPAAVVPLAAWLPDDVLQAIAEENNLSETAFTVADASGAADYELRWFTPTTEVEMCGHATLASGHVLIGGRDKVRFRTRQAGVLEVGRDGERYVLDLPTRTPTPKPLPDVLAALRVTAAETLWHDNGYGLIVVEDEDQVRGLDPDFDALRAKGDMLTVVTAPGRGTDIVSRVFACGSGIDEDPVTGAAHAVCVPYWAKRLGRERFSAYQASRRGGHLDCRLARDRVLLGGTCVTVIEGRMHI